MHTTAPIQAHVPLQNGDLFASILLFLSRDQLRLTDEEVSSIPPCSVEHCFAYCVQDVRVADVVAVRPFLPSKVFVKDSNRWRAATEVCILLHNIVSKQISMTLQYTWSTLSNYLV